jgi:DNA-binding transcriptional MerR regulator
VLVVWKIGLLSPAERSDGSHRVYDEAAVQRLYSARW